MSLCTLLDGTLAWFIVPSILTQSSDESSRDAHRPPTGCGNPTPRNAIWLGILSRPSKWLLDLKIRRESKSTITGGPRMEWVKTSLKFFQPKTSENSNLTFEAMVLSGRRQIHR